MSKKVKALVRLLIQGGGATPGAVGSALGQHQVNIMEFCKAFNASTADRKSDKVPVLITVYVDKSFTFVTKTSPASEELKKRAKIAKGSGTPGKGFCGEISWALVEEVAQLKMVDLNAVDLEGAKKIIAGTARSMGLKVV